MSMQRTPRFDPMLPWENGNPYVLLAGCGVRPNSTLAEVLDASYELPPNDEAANRAWENLRTVRKRLTVDFFAYTLRPAPFDAPVPEPHPLPYALLHQWAHSLDGFPEPPAPAGGNPPPAMPPRLRTSSS